MDYNDFVEWMIDIETTRTRFPTYGAPDHPVRWYKLHECISSLSLQTLLSVHDTGSLRGSPAISAIPPRGEATLQKFLSGLQRFADAWVDMDPRQRDAVIGRLESGRHRPQSIHRLMSLVDEVHYYVGQLKSGHHEVADDLAYSLSCLRAWPDEPEQD